MSVTIKNIAEMVGVSRQAAASVLNDTPVCLVSKENKEKILKLARELRYIPNNAARVLKGKSLKVIGSILDGFGGSGAVRQENLTIRLHIDGFALHTIVYVSALQARCALDSFISTGVSALLFPHYILKDLRHEDFSLPVIITDGEEIGDTFCDYTYGMRVMAEHLIWHGHTKLCFVCTENVFGNALMYEGYRSAVSSAGLEPFDVLETIGHPALNSAFDYLLHKKKVTAFLCSNDRFAGFLQQYLIRRGIRMPEDVAISGFGGYQTPPGIATMVTPIREDTVAIEKFLLTKIEQNILTRIPEPLRLRPYLYPDHSCGCPFHSDCDLKNTYSFSSYDVDNISEELQIKVKEDESK